MNDEVIKICKITDFLTGSSEFEQYLDKLDEKKGKDHLSEIDELEIKADYKMSPRYMGFVRWCDIVVSVPGLNTRSNWERYEEHVSADYQSKEELQKKTEARVEELEELLEERGYEASTQVLDLI